MEEPGGLQSMGSLGVGHDQATSLSLFPFMRWRRKWQPTPVFSPWESQGWGSLVGCCLWGRTESDTTERLSSSSSSKVLGDFPGGRNAGDPNLIPGWGRSPWDDWLPFPVFIGFPSGSDGKQSACNVGYLGLIPGLGRSPGGGHGNPLQYSCLENPHGLRSLAGYSPWGCKESDMTELLSTAHKVLDSKSHWDRNFVFTAIS